ncbi:outer dynein arm-docking complex subunit 3-like [Ylistrum balloti]|uniref:outer dynein arm-docking complex subunit 3-like n=1 Tax=Ylistrum balloti TaxID=509963 RepID=UPI002905E496|nr:outer dynein arm-docking complex subunit 3-like [Ylistrum balloti]
MPQQNVQSNGLAVTAWSTSEQVDEVRGKLHLKERDAKAFYESSETKKIEFEQLIAKLRAENKLKRITLAKSIAGDEKVIRSVFQNRRKELLSMQRYTIAEAINTMDQKVCVASKRLNDLKYQRNQREERLSELCVTAKHTKTVSYTDYNVDREREIRRLQNEMDKARIKYEAARNISRRYEEIMMHMQEEVRNYPARLDLLEQIVGDASSELAVLHQMNEKAIKTSEESRKDLHVMEREMYQAKRARDMQLNETRKEVERRKETSERAEKRAKVNLIADTTDTKAARLQLEKAERQEKILELEMGFEKIKSAINVSDIDDVVMRVLNQEETTRRIKAQEKEKLRNKKELLREKYKLNKIFEEVKFTSERQLARARQILDDVEDNMAEKEKCREKTYDTLLTSDSLLLDIQSGIATLNEKLKDVKLKPPFHNFTTGDPVKDLLNCSRKLDRLQTELVMQGGDGTTPRVDFNKLHEFLESRLPPSNIRIKVDVDDGSDEDDFHFDHDQENEGLLSREDIKRLGQEMLNSKLRPKKKRSKKRAN